MNTTTQHLKRIQEKLLVLLKNHQALQKENHWLKEELRKSKQQVGLNKSNIDELKQQVNIMKMNSTQMSEVDKKEFESRLNSYVKEIDRCIAMLGQ
jgi:chromosome segregation ATPase